MEFKNLDDRLLVEQASAMPMESVVRANGCDVKRHYVTCPVCQGIGEPAKTKCTIHREANKIKCFSCGWYGDGISYTMEIQGLKFWDACRFLTGGTILSSFDFTIAPVVVSKPKEPARSITDKHKIYKSFVDASNELEPLSSIPNRNIEGYESRFFNFPSPENRKFWALFKHHLIKNEVEIKEGMLKGIPGFFKKNGKPYFLKMSGYGIVLTNENGLIEGLQLRQHNVSEGYPRYLLFSSGRKETEEGTSCGQMTDIYSPSEDATCGLITEGSFKAICAAQAGYSALSLNGICSQKPVPKFANYLVEKGINRVDIALDAEYDSPNILSAIKKIVDTLDNFNLEVKILVWDQEDGKGLDDLINNNRDHLLTTVSPEEFFKIYPVSDNFNKIEVAI